MSKFVDPDYIENATFTLKTGTASADTVNGVATVLVKIPGIRWVKNGAMWFAGTSHKDDIVKVFITDEDNILGFGAGAVVGGYVDTDLPSANQGIRINSKKGYVVSEALVNLGKMPANLYVKIVGTTGDSRADTLCVNVLWGVQG